MASRKRPIEDLIDDRPAKISSRDLFASGPSSAFLALFPEPEAPAAAFDPPWTTFSRPGAGVDPLHYVDAGARADIRAMPAYQEAVARLVPGAPVTLDELRAVGWTLVPGPDVDPERATYVLRRRRLFLVIAVDDEFCLVYWVVTTG